MKSKNWIVLSALLLAGLVFNSTSSQAQVRVTAVLPAPPLPPLPPPLPVPVVVAPAPVYYEQPRPYYAPPPRAHYHYDHRRPRGYYYRATYARPCRSNYYHGRGEWHSNGHRDNGHHYGHRR